MLTFTPNNHIIIMYKKTIPVLQFQYYNFSKNQTNNINLKYCIPKTFE